MSDFVEGEVYYQLKFPDPNLAYPLIETLVYVGKNISDEDMEDTWYFQFVDNYAKFGSVLETQQGDRKVCSMAINELSDILDLKELIDELENASLRRLRIIKQGKQ